MTTRLFRRTPVAAALSALSIALAPGFAQGAGFALQEQNASGLGHAYAGGAAAAEDVSTIFYNPAGLVRLQSMQLVVAANLICPSTKFHDSASQAAFGQPIDLLLGGYHLSGKAMEARIETTVRDLRERIRPRLVAPGHCTGWRAKVALAQAFAPDRYGPSAVGTAYTLRAPE